MRDFIDQRLQTMKNRKQITKRGRAGAQRWLDLCWSLPEALQGKFKDSNTDTEILKIESDNQALDELLAIDRRLGETGASLVRAVLIEGATAGEITHRLGKNGKNRSRATRATAGMIEVALESLADHFHLPGGGGERKRDVRDSLPRTAVRAVDDPNNPRRKLEVVYATRDDVLGAMLARELIDGRRFDAGRRWQAVFALTEVAPRQNNFWDENVDGGTNSYTGSRVARAAALNEMATVKELLAYANIIEGDGERYNRKAVPKSYNLVLQTLGKDGLWPTEAEIGKFISCLDVLADAYSYWGDFDAKPSWAA